MVSTGISVVQLAAQLTDNDWHIRQRALHEIKCSASLLEDDDLRLQLLSQVVSLATDVIWQVREALAWTVDALGSSELVVNCLVTLAEDWHPEVAQSALRVCGVSHSGTDAAIEAIASAATERHADRVRAAALSTFADVIKADGTPTLAMALAARLGHDDASTRASAVEALVLLGRDASASVLQAVASQLLHEEGHVRVAAVLALREVGLREAVTVEALLVAARDHDCRVRQAATSAMLESVSGVWTSQSAAARALLTDGIIKHLHHESADVRQTAISILQQLALPGHREASSALAECLEDEVNDLRHRAAQALNTIVRPGDAQTLVALSSRAGHPDEQVRTAACTTLRHIATDRDAYTVALISQHIGDSDAAVRNHAAGELHALQEYADVDSVQKVLDLLGHSDAAVRKTAVETLSNLALARTASTVDKLVSIHAAMSQPHERQAAITVLGNIAESRNGEVLNCLIDCLDDAADEVRTAACEALGKVYPADSKAVGMISERLPERSGAVCASLLKALAVVAHPGDAMAGFAAASALESRDADTRCIAIEVLWHLCDGGGASLSVKQAVTRSLSCANPDVRKSVVQALEAVSGAGSDDTDTAIIISDILESAVTWGVRGSAAEALIAICSDGGAGSVAAAISRLASCRDEEVWRRSLPAVLASVRALGQPLYEEELLPPLTKERRRQLARAR